MADDARPNKYAELDPIVGSTVSEREACIADQLDQKWNLGINYARTVGSHWDAQFFSSTQAVLTLGRDDDAIHVYDKRGLRLRTEPSPSGLTAVNGELKPDPEGRAAVAMVLRDCAGKNRTAIIPPAVPDRNPERSIAAAQEDAAMPEEKPAKFLGGILDGLFKRFGIN